MKNYFERFLGEPGRRPLPRRPTSEIAWSWLGSFAGIFAVYWVNAWLGVSEHDNLYLVGSFGATAVLIYGAPAGDFSQPRSLIGGHFISAALGVLAAQVLPGHLALAAALAVATAVAAMHLTRTLHPPGGATALIAVIGGPSIHALGFRYVLAPVMLGALIMLVVALIVNNLSSNPLRQYPRYWL